jgi:hypothetical protein
MPRVRPQSPDLVSPAAEISAATSPAVPELFDFVPGHGIPQSLFRNAEALFRARRVLDREDELIDNCHELRIDVHLNRCSAKKVSDDHSGCVSAAASQCVVRGDSRP